MIPDRVPFVKNAPDQIGVCLAILPDNKKRGFYIFLFQDVEDLRRPLGIRPVVKCKRDLALLIPGAHHYIGRRDLLIYLTGYPGSALAAIGLEIAQAGFWLCLYLHALAFALEIDVITVLYRCDVGDRIRLVSIAKYFPERRGFAAHSPHREPRYFFIARAADLVVGGRRVKKPDGMSLAVFLFVTEIWIS